MIYISNRKELLDYCKKNYINPSGFNEPVTLRPDFVNLFDNENSYEYLLDDGRYIEHSDYMWDDWDDEDEVSDDFEYNPTKGHFYDTGELSKEERKELYDLRTNGLFGGFTNFNSDIIISPGVKDISGLLGGAISFNRVLIIPEGVENVSWLFNGCSSFNQIPVFPSTVTAMQYAFQDCVYFDKCFTIPSNVQNCEGLLAGCIRYNQPVFIPSSVKDCSYMLSDCVLYNQKIIISYGVKNCSYMFDGCDSYNQDTEIPESVINATYMFRGCKSFNSKTNIPSWMIDYSENLIPDNPGMFANCRSFSEPECYYKMFYDCESLDWDKVSISKEYDEDILDRVHRCAYGNHTSVKPVNLPKNLSSFASFPEGTYNSTSLFDDDN